MILACDTCGHQIVVRNGHLSKDSRSATCEPQCATCGAVYRVTVVVLRETPMTEEQLKTYKNRPS
jgi:hypothetical protein